VVTYVANADNYKQKYNDQNTKLDALQETGKGLKKQLNDNIAKGRQTEDDLNNQIVSLKSQIEQLNAGLTNSEREKAALLEKVNGWTSITKDFYQTTDKQGQLLKNTLEELNKLQAEQIKQRKELDETTAALVEKMAIIETLETEKKRLVEEKADLQNRLGLTLLPGGQVPAEAAAVTPPRTVTAKPAAPVARDIDLEGLITEVDTKNSVAGISIGSADGVRIGTKFHVVRNDEFICDILIIEVDSEQSVGVLEMVQQQPRVGDKVLTNL
jgi:hypothetical protein